MTEFSAHTLIDLEKLFQDDPLEILQLQQAFEINGWCFVRLSQNSHSFVTQLNHIIQSLSEFFTLNAIEKSHYLSLNAFGYTRVDHKEGIKLLVDQSGLVDLQSALPMNIKATLQHLSKIISDLTYRLKPIIMELTQSDHQPFQKVELSNFAMLDIVHYFNKKTGPAIIPEVGHNTNEVNCVPHYDPGLFSLSILSTCDGLQLKDQRENKWIDGPNNAQVNQANIGVIWLGEAASIVTGNRFKSGIHRVVYPRTVHQARLTIWQEVCTEAQIKQLFDTNSNVQLLPAGTQVMLENQPNSLPMDVLPGGETPLAFMNRVESTRGLSMSKSAPAHIKFSSGHNNVTNALPGPAIKNKAVPIFKKNKK